MPLLIVRTFATPDEAAERKSGRNALVVYTTPSTFVLNCAMRGLVSRVLPSYDCTYAVDHILFKEIELIVGAIGHGGMGQSYELG